MISKGSDPWLSATMLVVGVATLGRALQVGDGILKAGTVPWLAIALAACVVGAVFPLPRGRASYGRTELLATIAVTLAWQVTEMLTRPPFNEVNPSSQWYARFRVGVLGAGLLAAAALLARGGWLRHVSFALLLGAHVLLGHAVLRESGEPIIDVYVFQRDSSEALSRGVNPYTLTFPDVIGPEWYGPGLSVNGRLQFGYPYMPLTLLLAWPAHALAGDYRYALLVAMTLSAALVAYAPNRPSSVSFGAAALLLLMPRGMYVLERGWTEPFVVLIFAALVFCAARLPRATPWVLGLLLASKQYVPFGAGAMLLLFLDESNGWRAAGRAIGKSVLAAVVVTLPLVLWDVGAFWHSAVALQFRQPFRWDALSFLAWWRGGERSPLPPPMLVVPFAALALATAAVLWRCRRTPAGFAAGTALVFFAFFAFNKQAFANYYYLVIAAMCCAVALATAAEPAGGRLRAEA
jgi:hypothetical protein